MVKKCYSIDKKVPLSYAVKIEKAGLVGQSKQQYLCTFI